MDVPSSVPVLPVPLPHGFSRSVVREYGSSIERGFHETSVAAPSACAFSGFRTSRVR
jgi:hypothetical protein